MRAKTNLLSYCIVKIYIRKPRICRQLSGWYITCIETLGNSSIRRNYGYSLQSFH